MWCNKQNTEYITSLVLGRPTGSLSAAVVYDPISPSASLSTPCSPPLLLFFFFTPPFPPFLLFFFFFLHV